ncbi:hypothetical protein [Streptomyces sp. NPDC006631]|uniref:hypothetical protein n=1 Tax=Streptomyces sp. NPDC006631 TaxID=3364752 RepID=UPI0036B46919
MSITDTLEKVVKAEVGYHEGYSNGHWNNHEKYADQVPGLEWVDNVEGAWCAVFAAWAFQTAKAPKGSYPVTASCATGVTWYKTRKRFSAYPAIGSQIFYGPGGGEHTGVVIGFDATHVFSVEGNTNVSGSPEGDGVYAKTHLRTDPHVYGYGYPLYEGGIESADPAWKSQNPSLHTSPAQPANPKPPAKPKPLPVVDLSNVVAARKADLPAATGHVTHKADVLLVEHALSALGYLDAKWVEGSWGTKTDTAYNKYRVKKGYKGDDAKGAPGLESLKKLAKDSGLFTVKA